MFAGPGGNWREAAGENDKLYEIEVSFITHEGDTIKVAAKCQGQAQKMAIQIAKDLNPQGEEFEIIYIKEITEE
jgi:hypothetical protein